MHEHHSRDYVSCRSGIRLYDGAREKRTEAEFLKNEQEQQSNKGERMCRGGESRNYVTGQGTGADR